MSTIKGHRTFASVLGFELTDMWVRCSTLTSWTTLHTAVLLALPPALSRVSRKPLALLDNVLDASASLTNSAFTRLLTIYSNVPEGAGPDHRLNPLAGPAASCALEALKSLVYKLAAAVRQWPTEAREAGLLIIHAAQLRVFDDATLTVPLDYDQSSNIDRMPAPLPELVDGLNDIYDRKERKHAAQCMVYMTLALPSTGFNFWDNFGYEDEQFRRRTCS
jgi:hypothetical protein